MIKKLAVAISVVSFSVFAAQASNPASDNASNSPYNGTTWNNGDNGGSGFGDWSFSNSAPMSGFSGEYVGGTGDGNPAFGLYASHNGDSGSSGNATANATRPFTGGTLLAGQTFSLDVGIGGSGSPGYVDTGGVIGLNLLSGSTPVFTFKFTGGATPNNWYLNDGGSDFATSIPFSHDTKINFSFTYDGGNNYDVLITDGTPSDTYSGVGFTATDSISSIDGVRLFDIGQGANQNVGFNDLNISAVPEPSTIAAGVLAVVGAFLLRRRRATV